MLRNNAIYYYCNLSSPYVRDAEGVKYVDYDLDVKVFPSGDKVILDRDEFDFNKLDYNYGDKLITIIENELQILLRKIDNHEIAFDSNTVMKDFEIYKR